MVSDIKTAGIVGVGSLDPSKTNSNKADSEKLGKDFGDLLKTKVTDAKAVIANSGLANKIEGVKFSQHALERMSTRGISFKPEEMLKLNDAIEKAAQKGSRESLVLMGDSALIVSIKNKTVVTAMDREAMKENVFTNIDSTVIL
ncbi:MAG: hypothetical protein IPM57_00220 [Oligoflexia bacterium]|nr:hypothetical protein [Oligoflexia bacterium]